MSSGHILLGQSQLPKALTHAARLLAACFLILQFSIAGIAGKFVGPHPDATTLCLNTNVVANAAAHPAPAAPLSHHHDNDCCLLNFGELSPGVVAIVAAWLAPPPASRSKPAASLFHSPNHFYPELAPLAPRAPPLARA